MARLHVTFTYSAAGSLKKALARLGIAEQVLPLGDDMSVGPIEPGDSAQRLAWEAEVLQAEYLVVDEPATARFWATVTAWSGTLVAWMSSRSGLELCGLHALVSRLPAAPIEVVDVADVEFRDKKGALAPLWGQSFSIVDDNRIVDHALLESAVALDPDSRESLFARWKQLGEAGSALRVLTDQGLVPAPISHFDDRIRSQLTGQWQSCARVVGDVRGTMGNGRLEEFDSSTFLFCRLVDLVEQGEIEGQRDGELWSFHDSKVRRKGG